MCVYSGTNKSDNLATKAYLNEHCIQIIARVLFDHNFGFPLPNYVESDYFEERDKGDVFI